MPAERGYETRLPEPCHARVQMINATAIMAWWDENNHPVVSTHAQNAMRYRSDPIAPCSGQSKLVGEATDAALPGSSLNLLSGDTRCMDPSLIRCSGQALCPSD